MIRILVYQEDIKLLDYVDLVSESESGSVVSDPMDCGSDEPSNTTPKYML